MSQTLSAFIKEKKIYLVLYSIFLFIGIIVLTQIDKGAGIFFFADNRTSFLNQLFSIATQIGEAIGYAIFGFIFLFIRFRYTLLMGATAVTVGIVAAIFKNIFRHPRPKPYFSNLDQDISDIVVAGHPLLESQWSSFPSGHTISGFAFFTVLALLTNSKVLQILALSLAILVGLSRVYLVYHFLEDILLGSFFGILIGIGLVYVHSKVPFITEKWYNKSLRTIW